MAEPLQTSTVILPQSKVTALSEVTNFDPLYDIKGFLMDDITAIVHGKERRVAGGRRKRETRGEGFEVIDY